MEIIKMNDINRNFTERVAFLVTLGYVVNPKTMSGTQGERCRIDLTKDNGKTVRRLYLETGYDHGDKKTYRSMDTVVFMEEEFENVQGFGTLWNGKGKIVDKTLFYKVGQNSIYNLDSSLAFTKSKDLAYELYDKHWKRSRERDSSSVNKELKPTEKVLEIVRKRKGYKTVKLSDIIGVSANHYSHNGKPRIAYKVEFTNKKPLYIG